MKDEIKTNTTEIQKIIRNYYEQLYTNKRTAYYQEKWIDSKEMHNLLRLNKKERENKNRPINSVILKNSPKQRVRT